MIPILSLLTVVTLSILITRIATVALTHTGLARESAQFQARSAFTGTGFTTSESERVVTHPVRRRIIMLLILLGNVGLATVISSLILTFVGSHSSSALALRASGLIGGLTVLWLVARSRWVDRYLNRIIDRALQRYTRLDVRDYASLMHLAGEYRIVELKVKEGDWIAGKTLAESRLRDEGIAALGIQRADGTYLGIPKGDRLILAGDTLILYGRVSSLEALDHRRCDPGGDTEHLQAVAQQKRALEEEKVSDPVGKPADKPRQDRG